MPDKITQDDWDYYYEHFARPITVDGARLEQVLDELEQMPPREYGDRLGEGIEALERALGKK